MLLPKRFFWLASFILLMPRWGIAAIRQWLDTTLGGPSWNNPSQWSGNMGGSFGLQNDDAAEEEGPFSTRSTIQGLDTFWELSYITLDTNTVDSIECNTTDGVTTPHTLELTGDTGALFTCTENASNGVFGFGNHSAYGVIDLALDSFGTVSVSSGATFWLSGAIRGDGGINKVGTGTLILAPPVSTVTTQNTYEDGFTLASGTVEIGSSASASFQPFGYGTVTLSGGTLTTYSTAPSFSNVTILTGGKTSTLSAKSASSLTVSGSISGGGTLDVSGAGSVILSGNNTFTGSINLLSGTLVGNGTMSLGAGTVTTTVSNGATLRLNDSGTGTLASTGTLNIDGSGVLSGGVVQFGGGGTLNLNNKIYLTAGSTFESDASSTLIARSPIMNGHSITKIGSGTLSLYGSNSYTLGTNVKAGFLVAANNHALGTGTTAVSSNATLRFANNVNLPSTGTISIAGKGMPNGSTWYGAINNALGTTNSYAGPITLTGNATIAINGGMLTLSGKINTAGHNLYKIGAGSLCMPLLGNSANLKLGSNVCMMRSADGGSLGTVQFIDDGDLQVADSENFASDLDTGTNSAELDTGTNSDVVSGSIHGSDPDTGALAGTLTKMSSGTLEGVNVQCGTLAISDGDVQITAGGGTLGTSIVNNLSIAGGGSPTAKLDLNDHTLIVDYTGTSPLGSPSTSGSIANLIATAYAAGSWSGNGIHHFAG